MIILKKNKVLYCDIDRSLIMWEDGANWHVHELHIKLLEQFKYQGHGIVLWSAGGWKWAEKAARMLKITHLVDLCINKPDWWLDDKSVSEFMPEVNRIFLTDDY